VDLHNAALNRPAMLSSLLNGLHNANLANDGILETIAVKNKRAWCAHSKREINPWWAVDLGRPMTIYRVDLTNRGDGSG